YSRLRPSARDGRGHLGYGFPRIIGAGWPYGTICNSHSDRRPAGGGSRPATGWGAAGLQRRPVERDDGICNRERSQDSTATRVPIGKHDGQKQCLDGRRAAVLYGQGRRTSGLINHRIEHSVPKLRKNRIREERIHNEIIVDAYGPEEQALGWYYYLENKIRFPFSARCITSKVVSPLRKGETVEIRGPAPEASCAHDTFVL